MSTYRAIPDFYDDEYADLDMLQRDVGFLISKLPTKRSDVLMLACGTGRAAIPVTQAGHRVLGVDIDPRMLALAERKRDFVGLDTSQLSFEPHDLLSMSVSRRFDVATILFNSFLLFTTLAEQDRVLENVARCLLPRGRLWIDVFNPDLARIAEDAAVNADVRMFFSHQLGVGVQRVTHIHATDRIQVRRTTFEYRWFHANGTAKRKTVRFDLTYLLPRELTLLLERQGFEIDAMWGDYDGSTLTPSSPRIIVSARSRPLPRTRGRVRVGGDGTAER